MAQEQQILEAAEAEFLLHGYDGTKTVAIAKRAGVTHAMLHYYFRTKENLFNKVLNDKIEILVDSIVCVFSNDNKPLPERIEDGMKAHFNFLLKNPDLPRFAINEIFTDEKRLESVTKRIPVFYNVGIQVIQSEIDRNVELGIMKPIKFIDLIVDIVSLNVFAFTVLPILKKVVFSESYDADSFFLSRKEENVRVIRQRILVNP